MLDEKTVVQVIKSLGALEDCSPKFTKAFIIALNNCGYDTVEKLETMAPEDFRRVGAVAAVYTTFYREV